MPIPTDPISKHPRSIVESHIQERILTGEWPADHKLPSEANLGEQFGVSRTAVREAIRRLQGRGLLKTINGSGTFVASGQLELVSQAFSAYSILSNDQESFTDLLELRMAIEGEAAAKLAENGDKADIKALEAHMERMASTGLIEEFAILDIDFHLLFLKLSKNQLFFSLGRALRDRYVRLAIDACRRELYGRQCTLEEHIVIVDAVRRGAPDEAREAARQHVAKSRGRWEASE